MGTLQSRKLTQDKIIMDEMPQSKETQFFNEPKTTPANKASSTQASATNPAEEAKQVEKLSQNLWGSLILGVAYIYFTFQLLLKIIDVASTIESPSDVGPVKGAEISFRMAALGCISAASIATAVFTKRILKKIKNNPPKPYFQPLSYIALIANLISPIIISIAFVILVVLSLSPS